jgi:hypothetical protein
MRSVDDNELFAYSADCVSNRIIRHTKYSSSQPAEHTDIIFEGVLDQMFRDVLLPSIIFDVGRPIPSSYFSNTLLLWLSPVNTSLCERRDFRIRLDAKLAQL